MNLSVLYGSDDNYAPYTGVSMTSLFENNKDVDEITVYLAAMNYSHENLARFCKIAQDYHRNLIILDTSDAEKKIKEYGCGSWNGSIATWLRFFVLDQIPKTVDYLIWLDSDTIVHSGISKLISKTVSNYPISAVCDCLCYWQRFRIGIQENEPYYNAGVLIFNMRFWQSESDSIRMMQHLQRNVKRYVINDQDLLNDYFRGKIYKLAPQFNLQGFLLAYSVKDYYSAFKWDPKAYYKPQEIEQAKDRPVITHFFRFLGDYPWTCGNNYHPCKELYEEWKAKTPWRDHLGEAPINGISFQIEKILYRVLPRKVFLRLFTWYTNRNLPHAPM